MFFNFSNICFSSISVASKLIESILSDCFVYGFLKIALMCPVYFWGVSAELPI